ncbi:unnamed protein product, partial [Ectocarpus sp. 13 AM-2016]
MAAQVWLTRKGGIAVAFLLLGGGSRGDSRAKVAGIVKDARHVVSSTRAAWGRSPAEETQEQKQAYASSKRTLIEQTGSITKSGINVEKSHPAGSTAADRGDTKESGSCMDLKLGSSRAGGNKTSGLSSLAGRDGQTESSCAAVGSPVAEDDGGRISGSGSDSGNVYGSGNGKSRKDSRNTAHGSTRAAY